MLASHPVASLMLLLNSRNRPQLDFICAGSSKRLHSSHRRAARRHHIVNQGDPPARQCASHFKRTPNVLAPRFEREATLLVRSNRSHEHPRIDSSTE